MWRSRRGSTQRARTTSPAKSAHPQIRRVIEFDSGVADTHVFRAGPEADRWSHGPVYRTPQPA